jgi:hypothetical protein
MSGQLKHIGLQVSENDLTNFYETLLGCSISRINNLPAEDAGVIFKIAQPVKMIQACFRGLELELFVFNQEKQPSFNHLCLNLTDAAEIAEKAGHMGFRVYVRQKPNKPATYFISDSMNNVFELKNMDTAN